MYSSTSLRIRPFGKKNGAVNYTSSRGPIELSELRSIAPSVFAEAKHDTRSDRYTYIPTSEILTGLIKEGFRPYAVMQGGTRDEQRLGFTKHLLRLRHDSQSLAVGGTHNEIILINSHDGTSSYRLIAGVFRLVCGNGLVTAQSLIEDLRVPHTGDIQGRVIDGCVSVLSRLPEVSDSIREMSALNLTAGEQIAFARAAIVARYDEKDAPITPNQVLTARRQEDAGASLWQVLNRSQESLVRGGIRYVQRDAQGRMTARRQTREIGGIDQNTQVNRALWTLAEEMRKLKA